jgi:putative Mg2+ transporter-C (MgtC) family protein
MMLQSILDAMDKAGQQLTGVERDSIGDLQRVSFSLIATKRKHELIRGQLLAEPAIDALLTFRDPEED